MAQKRRLNDLSPSHLEKEIESWSKTIAKEFKKFNEWDKFYKNKLETVKKDIDINLILPWNILNTNNTYNKNTAQNQDFEPFSFNYITGCASSHLNQSNPFKTDFQSKPLQNICDNLDKQPKTSSSHYLCPQYLSDAHLIKAIDKSTTIVKNMSPIWYNGIGIKSTASPTSAIINKQKAFSSDSLNINRFFHNQNEYYLKKRHKQCDSSKSLTDFTTISYKYYDNNLLNSNLPQFSNLPYSSASPMLSADLQFNTLPIINQNVGFIGNAGSNLNLSFKYDDDSQPSPISNLYPRRRCF